MSWALLPLKDLVQAKTRLSGLLAPHERRALAQAMVEDVLAALTADAQLDGVLLVSDDPGAELLAHRYGAELLQESELACSGLNAVISAASDYLAARGVEEVMVVHSDLPLLSADDIRCLLERFRQPEVDVLISPDRRQDGTNIMVFRPSRRPPLRYGPGSFAAHQSEINALGLSLAVEPRDNVGLDVDEPRDLLDLWALLQGESRAGHTATLLQGEPLSRRIAAVAGSDVALEQETGQ